MLWWLLWGCGTSPAPAPPEAPPALERGTFNADAALGDAPVFWVCDQEPVGVVDPGELVWLWNGQEPPADLRPQAGLPALPPSTDPRQEAVRAELGRGRPTLVRTVVAPDERDFVRAMMGVGAAMERLYALQKGVDGTAPADDLPSRALFRRNQGPDCTSDRPACSAAAAPPPVVDSVYPASLHGRQDLCATLDAQGLLDPFTAVRAVGDALVAVPFGQAWPGAAKDAADALHTAAAALPAEEEPLAAYLRAAATSLLDDDWNRADAAWLATRERSRWYVRVGPDETYWDACDRKAGYHLLFARINPEGLAWERRLEPHKAVMERALAAKAAPYQARDVAFSLPEFIDVVLNAGDSRDDLGATVGQSLPNWGPVAEAGGRTVAMTNLGTDADSLQDMRDRFGALFCDTYGYTADPEPLLFSTLLHEAAHNLGPAAGYRVGGKTDEELFGGELASMLEELKAQTAALYLTDQLVPLGVVDAGFARRAHLADLLWAMGHIAEGMTDADGGALTYSQLAAVQVGLLQQAGVLTWQPEVSAANGTDTGCFTLDLDGLPGAIDGLADVVLAVKGQGDVERARALQHAHVEEADAALFATIRERWRRAPENTFVYGFEAEGVGACP